MKLQIREKINKPEELEKLYRADKKRFKSAFYEIYPEIAGFKVSVFWKSRLDFNSTKESIDAIKKSDILFLILSCLFSAFLIKIHQLFDFDLDEFFFYARNAGLIVFFGLASYLFLTKEKINLVHVAISAFVFFVSAVYINLLPSVQDSDSINLAYLHLPFTLWCLYGFIFFDFNTKDKYKRIDYIKYNGDLAILMAVILIAGGIFTGVTIGLFSAIELEIEQFYVDYVVIGGLVSVPIVATFIIKKYPFVTNKIAPIIAGIFSPIVFITLFIYLISILITGKNPYNDRDFLIVFNLMLLGVMGIIVFSVSEASAIKKQKFTEITLFALSIITLIVDMVALSAILYRLGEFGFTPNRTAVLGSNLLIFGNLVLIMIDLYKVNFKNKPVKEVELTIAGYLPVYLTWTIFVVFAMPFIFGMK